MASLEHIGREPSSSHELYLVNAASPDEVPRSFNVAGPSFVCLLAWDADASSRESIVALAHRLIHAGCAYICCWGAACSLVHDIFDLVSIERGSDAPLIMSTWHESESLDDALWFALFTAFPDDALSERCRSVVAVAIGSPSRADQIRHAMANPRRFSARLLDGT